jgi:hypothetical protein
MPFSCSISQSSSVELNWMYIYKYKNVYEWFMLLREVIRVAMQRDSVKVRRVTHLQLTICLRRARYLHWRRRSQASDLNAAHLLH